MSNGTEGGAGALVVEELQRLALEALERGDRDTARRHLCQGIDALKGSGDRLKEAELRFALGLTHLRVEGERGTAFDQLSQAARLALDVHSETLFLKCLRYLSEAVSSDQDLSVVVDLAGRASLSKEGHQDAEQAVAMARLVLGIRQGPKRLDPAVLEGLTSGEVAQRLLESGLLPESYSHLLAAGQAEARGDLALAEREAEAGRKAALDAVDPFLYILSCGAIARIRDEAGDRVGALTILFTCRASIEDLLGPVAAAQVVQMIDALEGKWGHKVFSETLAQYRRQFEEV